MSNTEIIHLRKELHAYPELSSAEFETAGRIRDFIEKHNPPSFFETIGETGLAAVYEYPKKGPAIAIRCELDALPIREDNQFSHRSKREGVSHKCGHDGHMAIVAGLIFGIRNQPPDSGKIILLFQPAEETGEGAYRIIQDEKFRKLEIDYLFALHNIPGVPLNSIILAQKGFSSEVQSLIIKLTGKESHAAEPENGINPATALAEIITVLSALNVNDPGDENFAILTPVHIRMGQKAYGISPADGEIHYTLRAWNGKKLSSLKRQIETAINEVCKKYKTKLETEWLEHFPASINDRECNDYVAKAAAENQLNIIERPYPFTFGEDFGWYSGEYKTAMFGLGAGTGTPALHHADYDFPDEIIGTGISMFRSIISSIMKTG